MSLTAPGKLLTTHVIPPQSMQGDQMIFGFHARVMGFLVFPVTPSINFTPISLKFLVRWGMGAALSKSFCGNWTCE